MKTYYFIVKNNDTHEFNIFGPVTDDTMYTNTVAKLQKAGEPVMYLSSENSVTWQSKIQSLSSLLNTRCQADAF